MNLTKNQIAILKLLISSNDYISSYDISSATGINRRLVREEMIDIKEICKSLGYELVSKTSKGYLLQGQDSKSLLELSHYLEQETQKRESLFPTYPEDRQNYIVTRLLEAEGYLKIDDLADELLISRSTISGDIKKIRHNISKYNLIVKQKPNY
ncbi:MAG: HTH domain-containing protein [Erysipelotrichaceae bacterium]|nr:HTH domain-containing protein [Erysipelotrichaceae bacterium]